MYIYKYARILLNTFMEVNMYSKNILLTTLSFLLLSSGAKADDFPISFGLWANYSYITDGAVDQGSAGTVGDEGLVVYVDHSFENTKWSFSGEFRAGPGSFTDKKNNTSGHEYTFHKAWVQYKHDDTFKAIIGKSQVPFGWKTANFWPGDMFQAAYGDQMDVGVKLIKSVNDFSLTAAYYHSDDWGSRSTDSTDDNRHWGSSSTYRKVRTYVGEIMYYVNSKHKLSISLQTGGLQDLTTHNDDGPVSGDHYAGVVTYQGKFDTMYLKAEAIYAQRDLPENYYNSLEYQSTGRLQEIETFRGALELGYEAKDWFYYLDVTWADTMTRGNDTNIISAYAPGIRYSYGSGWIYLEYLTQNGWMDRNADTNKGNFSALYLSVDYYF